MKNAAKAKAVRSGLMSFKKPKAGCNQTSIHDDCPALKGLFLLQCMFDSFHLTGRWQVRNDYWRSGLEVTTCSKSPLKMASALLNRCGYLLVSGQVYRCGLVGSPVQCSSA